MYTGLDPPGKAKGSWPVCLSQGQSGSWHQTFLAFAALSHRVTLHYLIVSKKNKTKQLCPNKVVCSFFFLLQTDKLCAALRRAVVAKRCWLWMLTSLQIKTICIQCRLDFFPVTEMLFLSLCRELSKENPHKLPLTTFCTPSFLIMHHSLFSLS